MADNTSTSSFPNTIEIKTLLGQSVMLDLESSGSFKTIEALKIASMEKFKIPSSESIHYSLLMNTTKIEDQTEMNEWISANRGSFKGYLTLVKSDSVFSKAWFWIGVQGLSSITLTLANKYLSMKFTSPLVIITLQNIFSVFFFFFVLLTWTSLEGLRIVSVPLVTVTRNLVPLLTALIETLFFGYQTNNVIRLSLLSVFIGSVFYSFTDFTLKWNGFHWVILNTACSVIIPIAEKRLLNNWLPNQTPTGMNFARNFLSIPMLICISLMKENLDDVYAMFESFDSGDWLSLVITSCFGFSIGLAYFFLLKLVSNTSISIANASYKLLTLLVSFLFFGVTFTAFGWIGVFLSFAGVFAFSYESSKPKPASK
ncbi:hypothetical protein C9374_001361 [Naegleria lovaniensis]|uniref:Sugar phosphate transporter domain-containing protein n=1 Tax=Naegleria lovaniensis TaxID=51637 RepID=A0AA88GVI3_NAELO|nr:uncharacterized protein C9374_001361 [Naegleria lovaniensis]KAG2387767.1 hypothetical protein C9374_001361 [Naegleria lovaniensis]